MSCLSVNESSKETMTETAWWSPSSRLIWPIVGSSGEADGEDLLARASSASSFFKSLPLPLRVVLVVRPLVSGFPLGFTLVFFKLRVFFFCCWCCLFLATGLPEPRLTVACSVSFFMLPELFRSIRVFCRREERSRRSLTDERFFSVVFWGLFRLVLATSQSSHKPEETRALEF